jgi:hypothetical protein
MKKILSLCLAIAVACGLASAQENQPNRIPQWGKGNPEKHDIATNTNGFWIAVEAAGGYSIRNDSPRTGFGELDVTFGYRVNQYARVGLGLGARWYSNTGNELRKTTGKWGMPIYLNVRGNIISGDYRNVVPYYSVDLGGSVKDGFMFRPSVGIRVGQQRNAFLIALSYTFQNLQGYELYVPSGAVDKNYPVSFLGLRLGYEF